MESGLLAPCPCGSGRSYGDCCHLLHEGAVAENALLVMKARYSAYALGVVDYLIATTHPGNHQYTENRGVWKRQLADFCKQAHFRELQIVDFQAAAQAAVVIFTAYCTHDGKEATFTEKSFFEKFRGRWLYRAGRLAEGVGPHFITEHQLKLLPLAYYGDAVLRKKAEPIQEISPDLRRLAEELIDTMDACDGAGLAAPQVHHSIRLFVTRISNNRDEIGEEKIFINPRLFDPSSATWSASEGCLSIPLLRAAVERPKEISVEYTQLDGQRVQERLSGWQARAVMHENDHLNGVLFIDRLDKREKARIASFLQNVELRFREGPLL